VPRVSSTTTHCSYTKRTALAEKAETEAAAAAEEEEEEEGGAA
jgi:hypothetical protein